MAVGVTMYAGHGSVATPGVVPAFGAAQARFVSGASVGGCAPGCGTGPTGTCG